MTDEEYFKTLEESTQKILDSDASKKLIVAGPGTGKTFLFKKAIEKINGTKDDCLVLTFINNLEKELEKDLGDLAKVYTFHGYSRYLISKYPDLSFGLVSDFNYYPSIDKIIAFDWKIENGDSRVNFCSNMRDLNDTKDVKFFIGRANYYNAVGFDDSIYRIYKSLESGINFPQKYKLMLFDEYQDFNLLESKLVGKMIENNPVIVAGDDDQALYCDLRGSAPDYIRDLLKSGEFEGFELPYCMRCPEPVIKLFHAIVASAVKQSLLTGRIAKKYDYFPPKKAKDSEKYPFVKLVITSVQNKRANYWGKYVLSELEKISVIEIEESKEGGFPTVLVIGSAYYLKNIMLALDDAGIQYDFNSASKTNDIDLLDGYRFIQKDNNSNLGWRIILEVIKPSFKIKVLQDSLKTQRPLIELLPDEFVKNQIEKATTIEVKDEGEIENKPENDNGMTIKMTTFEGSKGLSAQHVFIVGAHNGDLPIDKNELKDIEVCKLLVALTRTRKQCQILCTKYFAGMKAEEISEYLKPVLDQLERIEVNKDYWKQ